VRPGRLEITDLLWSYDATSDARLRVERKAVADTLRARGQSRAARIVNRLPEVDGYLVAEEVDALGVRIHCELQRLGEELQLGRRAASLIAELLLLLGLDDGRPVRLLDVGCGVGHVLRSIAFRGDLPAQVELVGVDLNPALTAEAKRLSGVEGLPCRFVAGDAFSSGLAIDDAPRTIVMSTGLLHHLDTEELTRFLGAQAQLHVAAFVHWDIAPCLWSTIGAWLFHQARMRESVSRHDGVLSARRAHPAADLLSVAHRAAPAYQSEVREGSPWHPRALDVLRPLVGVRT
jgi:SAM-dependent methyltransferase